MLYSVNLNLSSNQRDPMQDKELKEASNIISNDGVIITPTDTLYGLAANIFSSKGVNRIFDIKDRDRKMALPILVSIW